MTNNLVGIGTLKVIVVALVAAARDRLRAHELGNGWESCSRRLVVYAADGLNDRLNGSRPHRTVAHADAGHRNRCRIAVGCIYRGVVARECRRRVNARQMTPAAVTSSVWSLDGESLLDRVTEAGTCRSANQWDNAMDACGLYQ